MDVSSYGTRSISISIENVIFASYTVNEWMHVVTQSLEVAYQLSGLLA